MKTALVLLAMICGIAIAQGPEERVVVQLIEDRFVPDKLVFRHGVEYRLELRNDGKEMHEFTAPEFFKAVEVRNPDVLERAAPEVLLQPGERKELRFVARQPGRYPLTCADHDWDGMVGEIVVE
jgi:uncharacterized cupredoxin-like copper-binding protein